MCYACRDISHYSNNLTFTTYFDRIFFIQAFDVTITTPPAIYNEFSSKELSLGFYTPLNCSATGTPKPEIRWYHDGKLINYDWIVSYKKFQLVIQTFEERDKGIYQCVATNVAGEAQATGLLSFKPKHYSDPPKNPKCLPLNTTSFKVVFDGPQNYKVCTFLISFIHFVH